MFSNKISLTTREFVGIITSVIRTKPGYYKVYIPELSVLAKEVIVYDETTKYKYTKCDYGEYGSWLPLQKGTYVVIRFKKNDLNSGVIEKIYSYEYPQSNDKHPNYYLLIKTLSKTYIDIDDNIGKFKLSLVNDTSYLEYTLNTTNLAVNNTLNISSTNVINIDSGQINLNCNSPIEVSTSSLIKGESINFKIPEIPSQIPQINKLTNNIVDVEIIQANITNAGTDVKVDINNNNQLSDNQKKKLNSIINNIVKSASVDFDKIKDVSQNITIDVKIPSLDDIGKIIETGAKQIQQKITTYVEEIEDLKYNISDDFEITPYYYKLLDSHNELVYKINQFFDSQYFQNLSENEKQEIINSFSKFNDLLSSSHSELLEIQSRYNLTGTILDINIDSLFYAEYISALKAIDMANNTVQNLNYLAEYNNIQTKLNNITNVHKSLLTMNKLKLHSNITINMIDDLLNKNLSQKIMEFKSKIYNITDSKKLLVIFGDEFNQYVKDYQNSINLVINKLKVLSGINVDKNNLPQKMKDILSDFNLDFNYNDLSTQLNILTVSLNKLKLSNTYQDFFNNLDNFYHNTKSIEDILLNKKDILNGNFFKIDTMFKTILQVLFCDYGQDCTTSNTTKKDLNNILNNLQLPNLSILFQILLQMLLNPFDFKVPSLYSLLCNDDVENNIITAVKNIFKDNFDSVNGEYLKPIFNASLKLKTNLGEFYSTILQKLALFTKIAENYIKLKDSHTTSISCLVNVYASKILEQQNLGKHLQQINRILNNNNKHFNTFLFNVFEKSPFMFNNTVKQSIGKTKNIQFKTNKYSLRFSI